AAGAATTLELFFDLVSVIAIAAVTAGLHHAINEGHGIEALPRFVFIFVAIWWAWMNFTWFASAFDNDDVPYRILVMVIMGGELMFAGGVGYFFDTLDFSIGIVGWVVMRVGMVGLWLRAAAGSTEYRTTCLRYALGITLAQIGWVVFFLLASRGGTDFFLWGTVVFLIEFSVPVWAENARATPFHRHHIIERYGLLMIISLGEILLPISIGFGSIAEGDGSGAILVTSISALVIVFAAWWVYFCEQEHLPSARVPVALLWGYGHVFVFLAAALLGAALAAEIDANGHHGSATPAEIGRWLGGGLALYALALWVVRDLLHALPPVRQVALPGMAILFLLAGALGAPSWAFAGLCVLMVAWRAPWASNGPI
ncbi:MAG: low temperature requirement protein A, partial [Rhodobacteraceae bacterium]|nr:low temperature requirement protein A [Paracoccaceae bacterium]